MNCSPSYFDVYSGISYAAAIRQDTIKKREYVCCTTNLKKDTLLYDFNLKVGDTLREYNTIGIGEINYVYGIDSVLIEGNYRKALIITSNNAQPYNKIIDTVIEGIGSKYGLLEMEVIPFESSTGLMCFWQNGYVVYNPIPRNSLYYDSCFRYGPSYLWTGINSVSSTNVSFSVFPNPANKRITLSFELPQQQTNATLQLYNAVGQLIETNTINGYKGTIEKNVSALPNGIYYYTLLVNGVITATNKMVVIH